MIIVRAESDIRCWNGDLKNCYSLFFPKKFEIVLCDKKGKSVYSYGNNIK